MKYSYIDEVYVLHPQIKYRNTVWLHPMEIKYLMLLIRKYF